MLESTSGLRKRFAQAILFDEEKRIKRLQREGGVRFQLIKHASDCAFDRLFERQAIHSHSGGLVQNELLIA
jgi:hypothetical protein